MATHVYPSFPYRAPRDLMAGVPQRRPLVVIGAGPVGLAAAIDARLQGLPAILFDEHDTVSFGSRAVCYAKRSLEILDRLGVGDTVVNEGVSWNIGRTFLREDDVYRFNLVPEAGHKRPGMINLQQYHLAAALVQRAQKLGVDLRWKHRVAGVVALADENLRNSTRSTEFIMPKNAASELFRNAALALARSHPFARKLVNSGRLSVPCVLVDSVLNTPDVDAFSGDMMPGAPLADAPVRVAGHSAALSEQAIAVQVIWVTTHPDAAPANMTTLFDLHGLIAKRLDARPGSVYLIRPPSMWPRAGGFDAGRLRAALRRATGHDLPAAAASKAVAA